MRIVEATIFVSSLTLTILVVLFFVWLAEREELKEKKNLRI